MHDIYLRQDGIGAKITNSVVLHFLIMSRDM